MCNSEDTEQDGELDLGAYSTSVIFRGITWNEITKIVDERSKDRVIRIESAFKYREIKRNLHKT